MELQKNVIKLKENHPDVIPSVILVAHIKDVKKLLKNVALVASRRKTRRYRHMKGGTGSCPTAGDSASAGSPGGFSIIPQELTNLGRSVQFGLGGAYNAVNGYDAPVNPMPYKGQLNGGNLPDDVMLRV